jgi:tRNA A37 methylthiotransferase MiaB
MSRLHAIEQLEAGISARINSRLLGKEVEVLVEGRKPSPDDDRLNWFGRNRQNKLVHFSSDQTPEIGELVHVRVERTSPWSLVGAMSLARVGAA